jgi:hypothetical protein
MSYNIVVSENEHVSVEISEIKESKRVVIGKGGSLRFLLPKQTEEEILYNDQPIIPAVIVPDITSKIMRKPPRAYRRSNPIKQFNMADGTIQELPAVWCAAHHSWHPLKEKHS